MTKSEIKQALINEGITCSYSGYNKTYYVSHYPTSGAILKFFGALGHQYKLVVSK